MIFYSLLSFIHQNIQEIVSNKYLPSFTPIDECSFVPTYKSPVQTSNFHSNYKDLSTFFTCICLLPSQRDKSFFLYPLLFLTTSSSAYLTFTKLLTLTVRYPNTLNFSYIVQVTYYILSLFLLRGVRSGSYLNLPCFIIDR